MFSNEEWRGGERGEWVEGWWRGDGIAGAAQVRFDAHVNRAEFSVSRAFSAKNSNLGGDEGPREGVMRGEVMEV